MGECEQWTPEKAYVLKDFNGDILSYLGKRVQYDVDISTVGCETDTGNGQNGAFYLVAMPASEPGSDSGDYYCDANDVNGEWCSEIDIQEANLGGWHTTAHTCNYQGFSSTNCDRAGSVQDFTAAEYGSGKPLDMSTGAGQFYADFTESTNQWSGFPARLTDSNNNSGSLDNTDAAYLNSMTDSLPGMTMVL